jgi:hypothetical protein
MVMPRKSPFMIILTDEQRAVLESRVRKYTSSYIDVVRAKIVLYAAEGMENKDIAARLDTSFQIVCKWRKRFFRTWPGRARGGSSTRQTTSLFPPRWSSRLKRLLGGRRTELPSMYKHL